MKPFLVHQGDVLLMSAEIPDTAAPIETNGLAVLAHGETTGHSHHIRGAMMFRDDGAGSGGVTYLRTTGKPIEHGAIGVPNTADHDDIELPALSYEFRPQVQWSDEHEPVQRVAD
jgi:hypothetical protein